MKLFKPCKGTSKALGYGCGDEVSVKLRKYGLCTAKCYPEWLYGTNSGKATNKGINKVSDKTKRLNDIYHARIKVWIVGKVCPVTGDPATEIHHTNGREYERLIDEDYWLGVTRIGHNYIHNNPKEARLRGWLK